MIIERKFKSISKRIKSTKDFESELPLLEYIASKYPKTYEYIIEVFEEYDDYEQEQLVKEWLSKNWFTIAAGIALGIGGLWGYGQWQKSNMVTNQEAAVEFTQLEAAMALDDVTGIDQLIADYESEFGNNIYSIQARLQAANKMIAADDLAAAK